MADNVQVDGIQQLDEEEKKKSRAIVLETIGEKEPPPVKVGSNTVNKRLDGILGFGFGKNKEIIEPVKPEPTFIQEQKIAWQKEKNRIIPASTATNIKTNELDTKQASNAFLADVKQQSKITKTERIVEPTVGKKVMPPVLPKKEKKTEIAKENKNHPKMVIGKRKKFPVKHSQFPITKLDLQTKNRLEQQPHLKGLFSFGQNWYENSKNFEGKINITVRRSLRWLGIFLGATIVIYLLFVITIIKTNADNKILRSIDRHLIVPALITPNGIIDYFQYQDIKNQLHLDGAGAKKFIIQRLIIENLYRRLQINPDRSIEDLSIAIINDKEINNVSLERIKKIDELIKQNNDFIAVAAKYGDGSGQLDLTPANRTQYSFSDQVADLKIGEISEVVYSPNNGYYIFKTINKSDTDQQLYYVFIQSKSLAEYLTEAANNYKLISFVN